MYIRQISCRRKDGSRLHYLQLAHKVRDPQTGLPRDQVLYHFGRADRIDPAQLRRLVQSLSRFLAPTDQVQAQLQGLGTELVVERSLAYGGSYVLNTLWKRLGLDQALRTLLTQRAFHANVERLLFALVANRALAPRSKLALERRVGRHTALGGADWRRSPSSRSTGRWTSWSSTRKRSSATSSLRPPPC